MFLIYSGTKGTWTEEQEAELRFLFEENQRNPETDKGKYGQTDFCLDTVTLLVPFLYPYITAMIGFYFAESRVGDEDSDCRQMGLICLIMALLRVCHQMKM